MEEDSSKIYDFIIVGAGCVGLSAAYQAYLLGKSVCLIEKQTIGQPNKLNDQRYWCSSFSARQNRIQYNEKYLVDYVRASNKYWGELEHKAKTTFNHQQGALWFGDQNATTSQGSIAQSNKVLQECKVEKLYMKSLCQTQPTFLRNFKLDKLQTNVEKTQNWTALYADQGGSINMKQSYNYFLNEIWKKQNINILEDSKIISYTKKQTQDINKNIHNFIIVNQKTSKQIQIKGTHILIAAGIDTPGFVNDIMKNQGLTKDCIIQEYLACYFQINKEDQSQYDPKNFPNFICFLDPTKYSYGSGYGFPYHQWDNPLNQKGVKAIKIGTLSPKKINNINEYKPQKIIPDDDPRVLDTQNFVKNFMNGLNIKSKANYPCPIIFYKGRETILDYLSRNQKDVVVQSGGWIGKYYPFLAKTAVTMLFNPQKISESQPKSYECAMKNFLERTRYPIRQIIQKLIANQRKLQANEVFDTIVVGAGCSGLYSAYRLNKSQSQSGLPSKKIGIFDMGDRIGGRLWSIKFQGSNTPMQLGGMRFIPKSHLLVANVVKQLQIPSLDFLMGGDTLQTKALKAYLRNDRYDKNQWTNLQKAGQRLYTAYRIQDPVVVGMNSQQIILYSIFKILMSDANLQVTKNIKDFQKKVYQEKSESGWITHHVQFDLETWNYCKKNLKYLKKMLPQQDQEDEQKKIKQPEPQPKPQYLFKFGFQNIIEDQFSHQVYEFVSSQNGYYSFTSNNSYIEQVTAYCLDFANVVYKTLSGGYDMFCFNLVNSLLDDKKGITAKDGGIFLQKELIYLKRTQDKRYALTFQDTQDKSQVTVLTDNIILGMPRRSIQRLYLAIPYFQKYIDYQPDPPTVFKNPNNLLELTSAVWSAPSMKIIMNFRKNWWDITKKHKEYWTGSEMRGVSVTDLPIRQCLYFGNDTDNMLLASYNDGVTVQFWSSLQDNFKQFTPMPIDGYKRNRICHKKQGNIAPASEQVVRQVLRQLQLLHGTAENLQISNVKQAMIQNWADQPFGGGYHFWKAGYNVEKVMKTVRRPWKDDRIFIVGEAFSNVTGWVQGALQTSQRMLNENYSLPFSLENYYPGW